MRLIALLLALGLERFLPQGNLLRRFDWFERYVDRVQQGLQHQSWAQQPYVSLILIVLPTAIPVSIIYIFSVPFFHGLLAFLIGAGILFYCLGPWNIYGAHRLPHSLFWQANETLYAAIFWFTLLGPVAVLIYRLVERSAHTAHDPGLKSAAAQVLAILDWLPVRVFSLLFALGGNFIRTSQLLSASLLKDTSFNQKLLEGCGRSALDLDEAVELASMDHSQALRLIDRSLVLFLIIVIAICIGTVL